MVAAHHLIWTAYGWWLPNDPRGSSSISIRVERIAELGEIHFGRRNPQPPAAEIQRFDEQMRGVLAHHVCEFDEVEKLALAESFAGVMENRGYICHDCAIMPEHIHMLIRRHHDYAETMIGHFQLESRKRLIEANRRPKPHPVWGGPGWKVFQNTRDDIIRTIEYIRMNPIKRGLPEQHWPFVITYDGWLP